MAPGRNISRRSATRGSEVTEAPTDKPGGRGKAAGLAVKRHKSMNKNQKPRVEFRRGLLKPVGPWAAVFASETARILRMNAPLAIRKWRKVDPGIKKNLHERILESFDVDIHVPHVRRAVNRFLGQRLKDFRSKLYKHYKDIADGLDKRAFPHEDVNHADWIGMCDWFETDEFQEISKRNTTSRKKQKNNHCCGSKPFVRIREEMKDQETQEEPGRTAMYHHTRFSKKKGCWVSPAAEENYNMMNTLQSTPTPYNTTPMTEDEVYDQVLGKRPGYVRGLGHGQDPLPTSTLDELDNVEEVRRFAEEAERRADEAERRAQEAQERFEESERRTDKKIQAMQQQMLNFMAQFQYPNRSMMDLLMGGIGSMGGIGGMGNN